MRRILLLASMTIALLCLPGYSQTVHPCFDFDMSGSSNITDLIQCSEVFMGRLPLPAGQGDIDGRDGFNIGDFRFYDAWLFFGGQLGACPPHPAYSILPGPDSIFLGTASIPPGDGQVVIPLLLKASNTIHDILLPIRATTTSGTVSITNIEKATNPALFDLFNFGQIGSDGIAQFSSIINTPAQPGVHLIGTVTVQYTGSSGGTVSLDTTSFGTFQFPHYLYGDFPQGGYAATTIAIPAIAAGVEATFPVITADPDSLYFETLVGYPNPAPQSFTIQSDGDLFAWTLTNTSWLQVTPSSGVSGQSVEVTPNISGLGAGTHVASIIVESSEAIGSPQVVSVYVKLKSQYPSFDANCDGMFSISDVVLQINYIFGGAEFLCDPCTGESKVNSKEESKK